MMADKSGWALVWKINGDFLSAALGLGLGYGFWRLCLSSGFELYGYIAVMFAIVGAFRAATALAGMAKLIFSLRKWARYEKRGAAPKADRLAGEAELRRKGLLK